MDTSCSFQHCVHPVAGVGYFSGQAVVGAACALAWLPGATPSSPRVCSDLRVNPCALVSTVYVPILSTPTGHGQFSFSRGVYLAHAELIKFPPWYLEFGRKGQRLGFTHMAAPAVKASQLVTHSAVVSYLNV